MVQSCGRLLAIESAQDQPEKQSEIGTRPCTSKSKNLLYKTNQEFPETHNPNANLHLNFGNYWFFEVYYAFHKSRSNMLSNKSPIFHAFTCFVLNVAFNKDIEF
ncbi:hypothetical protein ACOSP7_009468 [Xanthoceras sorbifolium]